MQQVVLPLDMFVPHWTTLPLKSKTFLLSYGSPVLPLDLSVPQMPVLQLDLSVVLKTGLPLDMTVLQQPCAASGRGYSFRLFWFVSVFNVSLGCEISERSHFFSL